MYRNDRIVIRLNEVERQVIDALAQMERLPASTLARRRLLLEAEQRGIVPRYGEKHNRAGEGSEAVPSAAAS
jgi:hypothetical protein